MGLQIKRHLLALPHVRMSPSSKWIGYLSVFSVLAVIGVLFNNQTVGQIVIIAYGIVAVLGGIKSGESFKLAVASFGVIILTTTLEVDRLAQHFSTYAFLFLCVGLACAIREQAYRFNDVLMKSYISGAYSRARRANPKTRPVFNRRLR